MPELTGIPALDAALAKRFAQKAEQDTFKRIKEATYASDLVPERQYEKREDEDQIDEILGRLGIVEAYNKWCGKMRPLRRSGQTEGVMISCPKPGHADVHPSAWANTEKNTWFCGGCWEGGDLYTIAEYKFGIEAKGKGFHDLRRAMVGDLGYAVRRSGDPKLPDIVEPVVTVPIPEPITSPIDTAISVTVVESDEYDDDYEVDSVLPTFNWRNVVPEDTFIHKYVSACSVDDAAEEYHFWNAMAGVGLAVGRNVVLTDYKLVTANLMLCLLGKSGDRKSRSISNLKKLIDDYLPFNSREDFPTGVKKIQSPASGESLIHGFKKELIDPVSTGKVRLVIGYAPIRGLIEFPELSGLVHRTDRPGSTLKDVILQFSDADRYISTVSMTHGEAFAENAFGTLISTTQPESLKDLISVTDQVNGFLNRWLFASGTPKKKFAIGGADVDLLDAGVAIQEVHAQVPRVLSLDEDALKLWEEHFYDVLDPVQSENPILVRLDLLEKKIMLLLAINDNKNVIDRSIVEAALLLHDYLVNTYKVTAKSTQRQSLDTTIYDEILRQIRHLTKTEGGIGPTKRRINQNLKTKMSGWPKTLIEKMYDQLARDDRIQIAQNKTGRTSDHYLWVN